MTKETPNQRKGRRSTYVVLPDGRFVSPVLRHSNGIRRQRKNKMVSHDTLHQNDNIKSRQWRREPKSDHGIESKIIAYQTSRKRQDSFNYLLNDQQLLSPKARGSVNIHGSDSTPNQRDINQRKRNDKSDNSIKDGRVLSPKTINTLKNQRSNSHSFSKNDEQEVSTNTSTKKIGKGHPVNESRVLSPRTLTTLRNRSSSITPPSNGDKQNVSPENVIQKQRRDSLEHHAIGRRMGSPRTADVPRSRYSSSPIPPNYEGTENTSRLLKDSIDHSRNKSRVLSPKTLDILKHRRSDSVSSFDNDSALYGYSQRNDSMDQTFSYRRSLSPKTLSIIRNRRLDSIALSSVERQTPLTLSESTNSNRGRRKDSEMSILDGNYTSENETIQSRGNQHKRPISREYSTSPTTKNYKAMPRRTKFDKYGRRLSYTTTDDSIGISQSRDKLISNENVDDYVHNLPSDEKPSKSGGGADKPNFERLVLPSIEVSFWDDQRIKGRQKSPDSSPKDDTYTKFEYSLLDSNATKYDTKRRRPRSPRKQHNKEIETRPISRTSWDRASLSDIQEERYLRSPKTKLQRESHIEYFKPNKRKAYDVYRKSKTRLSKKENKYGDRKVSFGSISQISGRSDTFIRPDSRLSSRSVTFIKEESDLSRSRSPSLISNSDISLPDTIEDFDDIEDEDMSRRSSLMSVESTKGRDKLLEHVNNKVKLIEELKQLFKRKELERKIAEKSKIDKKNSIHSVNLKTKPIVKTDKSFERKPSIVESVNGKLEYRKIKNRNNRKQFLTRDILHSGRYIEITGEILEQEKKVERPVSVPNIEDEHVTFSDKFVRSDNEKSKAFPTRGDLVKDGSLVKLSHGRGTSPKRMAELDKGAKKNTRQVNEEQIEGYINSKRVKIEDESHKSVQQSSKNPAKLNKLQKEKWKAGYSISKFENAGDYMQKQREVDNKQEKSTLKNERDYSKISNSIESVQKQRKLDEKQERNKLKNDSSPNKFSNPKNFTWQQIEEWNQNNDTDDNGNSKQSENRTSINDKKKAIVRPTIRKKAEEVRKKPGPTSKSEIPGIYSDEEEVYPDPRPYTDTYRAPPPIEDKYRYEQTVGNEYGDHPARPPITKSYSKKGRLVTFFRNGDVNFKGKTLCINQKNFATFETLLVSLTEKIPTTSGVHYIFTIPDGREIKSITEFVHGRSYVVSSNKKPEPTLGYGYSKEQHWINKRPSAGKFRKKESELLVRDTSPSNSPMKKPRVITVINNLSRERREKIFINPNSHLSFEELLNTIEDVLDMSVVALYTEKPPHQKVESYSQILREFKKHTNFIACGREPPMELTKTPKRQAPSSNSSSDSTGLTSRKKKLLRQNEFDGIEETDVSPSPPPPVSQQQMLSDDNVTEGIIASYRAPSEPIRVDIHGKTREYFMPSEFADNEADGTRPERKLKLEWIYGYRSSGTHNNLLVYHTGELLYHVAAVAVLYNKSSNTQRHYLGHTEEISCMSLHPNKRWVATGQISGREQDDAHIRIWDGKTLSTYNVIGMGFFKVGITSIGFSSKPDYRRDIYSKYDKQQSGFYMCALDSSDKHVLSVWDWQKPEKERLIARTTTSIRSVTCACFYPKDHTILITYGEGHVYFWQLFWNPERESEGRLLRDKESGLFLDDTPRMVTSIAFAENGDVLTGDSSGSVTIWSLDENYAFRVNTSLSAGLKNAHRKPVTALCILNDGTLLSGGGIEIRAWDSGYNYRRTKERRIPDVAGDVCAIVPVRPESTDGELYIGTSKSCILEGSLQKQFLFRVHGHSNELWSIESHPEELIFFTAAHDQLVIKWISKTHRIAWRTRVENPCSAIALDRRAKHLAIGTVAGQMILLNAENGMHIITVPVGGEQINAIKYSPDESMLAMGDHGGCIHIFYVHEDGRLYRKNNAKLKGVGSFVTHLDWSSDSRYLQSSNGDYDLKYWNVEEMQRVTDHEGMRDVNWHTFTCNVGYAVCGAWTNLESDEHLHVAKRANYREYMITGDNKGRLRLYKYPCAAEKPDFRGTKLYSSDVTAVNFLHDDSSAISSGGTFPVLAQWTVMDRQ